VSDDDTRASLCAWFGAQLPEADDVRIEGLDRVELGHSAETMLLTVVSSVHGHEERRDVVLRMRPPAPGLLEPYDLERQFRILRALDPTPVRSPTVYWYEGTGEVLGREFYVMQRLDGTVYEQGVPAELEDAPERIARMSRGVVEQLAAIHRVDLEATGLGFLGDGRGFLTRELEHWGREMRRVQQAPLPALEQLLAELVAQQPAQSATVTLVHGDPKPGNFAFVGDEVSAVFDWELATVGDPLADIGWAEVNWTTQGSFTIRPGGLTTDDLVARYEELSGIAVVHREWYRAFQGFKMCIIMLVGSMLFDQGVSDDLRFAYMGMAVHMYTKPALAELGNDDDLEPDPVTARAERVREVQARTG